jgi:ribosome-associated translation inhibitor RaiA
MPKGSAEEQMAEKNGVPVEVVFRNLDPSPAIETLVRQKAAKLAQFAPRLMNCRVVVALPNRRHQQGKIFAVSIELEMPNGSLWVNRTPPMDHSHEDVRVAIHDAFDAGKRRLQDAVRRTNRRSKQRAERTRRRPAPKAGA